MRVTRLAATRRDPIDPLMDETPHARDGYDLILVGSGFASSFFLRRWLARSKPGTRVLVLERGRYRSHAWQLENQANSPDPGKATFSCKHPHKRWTYTPGFGGSSNCWWACTPRLHPSDFELRSRYGVGVDWPVRYDELERYYTEVEEVMEISGPAEAPYPRSRPYVQGPHVLSAPEQVLQHAFPGAFFPQPTARARRSTGRRGACCGAGVCHLCPKDAKFTVLNGMTEHYFDPRVEIVFGAQVQQVVLQGGAATGVRYLRAGRPYVANAAFVGLGANALFNPHILLRSGLDHPKLGKGLHEQASVRVLVDLDGLEGFGGSTSITGHGYMLYDGEHRREHGACLIESHNVPLLRTEKGRWRQRMMLKCIVEDLPEDRNYVRIAAEDATKPEAVYVGHSDYAQRGLDALPAKLAKVLAPLPVESIEVLELEQTESHIQGCTPFGDDPATSIVDRDLVHHQVRNLAVLGASVFPTCSPANPTLTLCALSTWAADHLLGP